MTMKSSFPQSLGGVPMQRRIFLSRAGLAAGAVVATSLVPLSAVHALPARLLAAAAEPPWTGHVDDACGHWPPYAHPIPYGPPAAAPLMAADPADWNFPA